MHFPTVLQENGKQRGNSNSNCPLGCGAGLTVRLHWRACPRKVMPRRTRSEGTQAVSAAWAGLVATDSDSLSKTDPRPTNGPLLKAKLYVD